MTSDMHGYGCDCTGCIMNRRARNNAVARKVIRKRRPKPRAVRKAMLVYQAGIANVFEVDAFHLAPEGRNARRLMQNDFYTARIYCYGLAAAGATIRTAFCNQAGDITDETWSDDFDTLPFREHVAIVREN